MRKLLTRLVAFTLMGLMLVPVVVQAQATDPLSVYKAYIDAYNRGAVEQAVSYFADNAIAKTTPAPPTGGSFSGKEQLRAWTQNAVNNHNRLEAVGTPQVSGDKVTGVMRLTSDNFKSMGLDFLDSNFEATVTNGKITSLNIGATPESLAKLPRPGGNSGAVPGSAPATGVGGNGSTTDNNILAWLIGLVLCGSLVVLSGLRVIKRKS